MIRHLPPTTARPRSGDTLTEVLMAMLIMSIGVSFVAAVFPLSVLRTIQASQLTAATVHRFQAEALIDMLPDLVHNPEGIALEGLDRVTGPGDLNGDGQVDSDDDRPNTYREHFGTRYIVDPWGYHVHRLDGTTFTRVDPNTGASGNAAVSDWFGVDAAGIGWLQRYDGGILAQSQNTSNVDPRLWAEHQERLAATLAASADRFQEVATSELIEPILDPTNTFVIGVRFSASDDLASAGNSPRDQLQDSSVLGVVPDGEIARITLFDERGKASQAYPVTHISGQDVFWTESGFGDLNADGATDTRFLPESFRVGTEWVIGHAVLEVSQSRYYTWLMSVRKRGDGNASVDVAVLFNRGVDAEDEYAYQATFVPDTNIVGLVFDENSEPEPFLKRGGYVFDAQNCRWYRVQDFRERPAVIGWGGEYSDAYDVVMFVEGTIIEPGGEDTYVGGTGTTSGVLNYVYDMESADDNANGLLDDEDRNRDGVQVPAPLAMGRAVLMPGIIQVYSLGTVNVPEDF